MINFRLLLIFAPLFFGTVPAGAAGGELQGAGATFPGPLYSKLFDTYIKEKNVAVNYQPIGSGGGILQLINKTIDFGGTDVPMNSNELKSAGAEILHFPVCIGAIAVTYNLPGKPELSFSPDVIADIYLGKIKKWNDPRIASLNPKTTLPDMAISVVHRSDGSGSSYTFSEYLSLVNPDWKSKVGTGKILNWPVGLGGKGNNGVAAYVRQIPGAIGYVELAYAAQNQMPVALVRNKSGNFIKPDLRSMLSISKDGSVADIQQTIVNSELKDAYPVCSYTWIIVYREQAYGGRQLERAKALCRLLWWVTHDGQTYNELLEYGRINTETIRASEIMIKSMTYLGKPILFR